MVLDVRKCLKPTQFYMLNIFVPTTYQKIKPWGVLALGLAYSGLTMALYLAQMGGPEKP